MNILKRLLIPACIALFMILYISASANPKDTPPNIIFMFADDLGWGDLSCYGNPLIKTPALDKMATEGTLFTQFYVAGSVCSPSRTGIMTGQYPARNRIYGHLTPNLEVNERRQIPRSLDPNVPTLTDALKNAGYTTGHFGKWHLGEELPSKYGVDIYRTDQVCNMPGLEPVEIWTPESRPRCTKDILNSALEFIKGNKEKPFYANVWFSDMHSTLNPSEEQLEKTKRFHPRGVDFYGADQIYFATLIEMDRQIGIFLDNLDQLGLSENTIVIFSSDNGPEDFQINGANHSGVGRNGPFRGRKRSIYEGGVRVPFIVRWPGNIPAGKVNSESVVNGIDFGLTLCSITGANPSKSLKMDGEDMSDVWLGSDRKRKRDCFWEWRYRVFGHPLNKPPRLAIRHGDYKLLMNPDKSRIELYNIIKDPAELLNLAANMPEMAKQLSQKLLEWNSTLPESPIDKQAGKNDWDWPGKE